MNMQTEVTEDGLHLPRDWFGDAKQVEIRREGKQIIVILLDEEDPIRKLGSNPVSLDITDASTNHDQYLTGSSE